MIVRKNLDSCRDDTFPKSIERDQVPATVEMKEALFVDRETAGDRASVAQWGGKTSVAHWGGRTCLQFLLPTARS